LYEFPDLVAGIAPQADLRSRSWPCQTAPHSPVTARRRDPRSSQNLVRSTLPCVRGILFAQRDPFSRDVTGVMSAAA